MKTSQKNTKNDFPASNFALKRYVLRTIIQKPRIHHVLEKYISRKYKELAKIYFLLC